MRKSIVVLVGSGLVLIGAGAPGADRSALFGLVVGLGLGLLVTLLAMGASASFRRVLQQTRLDEQVLSIGGQYIPAASVDERLKELDPSVAWMLEMKERGLRGQVIPSRHFEQVENLPQVEFMTEFVR